ncbi:MAG: Glu-tRNA(Gln) amidotransferase subunit GatE [archaeon]|nr:Glu-tRNA(Gln) amidotransferase subunit GatE [archaeon]
MTESEFICGIEIHQQLDTKKLFCSCDSHLCENVYDSVYRRLRPTASEMGEIDRAALVQSQKNLGYRYQLTPETSCLVELDDEPPHNVNVDAMNIALIFSEMMKAQVVDEVHFMRKIVVDGSNPSGFQRTALIATDGEVEVGKKKISILSVCLEEDACRKIESVDGEITYRLDRLGIPLIEIATGPEIRTPEECMEVALRIGSLLRATKKVKRGIGTIREDLNISVFGGARTEIKGVQELKLLPLYVQNEVDRQKMLLRVKDILVKRGTKPVNVEFVDVTEIFDGCKSKVINGALSDNGKIIAVRLPGFGGVMRCDDKKLRLGAEIAQRAKSQGVKGIFHSDELPGYGIEQKFVVNLKKFLGITDENDAFVICAAKDKKAKNALQAVIERANLALIGVPEETRDPLPDGTSKYSRPLPGAARMYPETDVPPIEITKAMMTNISNNLPEFPEKIEERLITQYGINIQQAKQIVKQDNVELFEKITNKYGMASVVATTFLNTYMELERDGIDTTAFTDEKMMGIFGMLKEGRFTKEALPALLREIASEKSVEMAIKKLGLEAIDNDEATQIIARIVKEREDFIKIKGGIRAVGPLMGPVMNALRGKIDGKKVNELLTQEIRKLME